MEITIQQWINNPKRQYADGVLLYEKFGLNGVYKILFRSEETEYTSEKLFELLLEMVPTKKESQPTNTFPLPKIATPLNSPIKDIPEVVKNTYDRAIRLHKEAGQLHARLPLFLTNEERLAAALELLNNGDERHRCWEFYDHFMETGELLIINDIKKDDFTTKSRADLIMIKQRHMVQRSKLRKKIDACGDETKLTLWRDKLLVTEQELKEVEELLSGEII
jgi:hypothetical protein